MKYNPFEKKVLRIDDCGDLLDKYNDLKEKENKDNENKKPKEKNENKTISKSRNNSKINILNNSGNNPKTIKVKNHQEKVNV